MRLLVDAAQDFGDGEVKDGGSRNLLESRLRTLYASGVFNGATVTFQVSPDGANVPDGSSRWYVVETFTDVGLVNIEARFRKCKANLAGGGLSTSVTLELV
jgi:hypothetical protein